MLIHERFKTTAYKFHQETKDNFQIYTRVSHNDTCCGCLNVIEANEEAVLVIYCNECGVITEEFKLTTT